MSTGFQIREADLERYDDGRQVWYAGQRVARLAEHPVLGRCIENRGRELALHEDPACREALCVSSSTGQEHCVVLHPPQSSDELVRYRAALELALDRVGGGVADRFHYTWAGGVGLMFHTLGLAQGTMRDRIDAGYATNLSRYLAFCQDRHVSMTTAFSEAKGDRRKPPWEQEQYLQVVAERDDGLVFRGMRRISTGAAYADELWVNTNPEVWRAGIPADQVSKLGPLLFIFSVPLNAPGLKILCRPGEVTTQSRFDFPLSWYDEVDAMIVFDDVLVPWERLFSYRDVDFLRAYMATGTGVAEYAHCICAASKAALVVGAAYLMAEANGDLQNPAFMGQIAELVMYLETLRACIRSAELDPESRLPTMVIPNRVALDVAVNTITAEYYRMLKVLRDLAGGSVTTNQSVDDLDSPEIGAYIERAFAGAIPGRPRLALLNLIEDLSASLFAARKEQYLTFSLGPPIAKRMALVNEYNFAPLASKVRTVLGM